MKKIIAALISLTLFYSSTVCIFAIENQECPYYEEIADVIEEVPTVCWCGKRAQCNTRYSNGKIVREGAQIMLGSNESYVALCRKHYKEGKLWK